MNVPQVEAFAGRGQAVRGWTDTEGYIAPLRAALEGVKTIAFDDEARFAFLMDLLGVAPSPGSSRPARSSAGFEFARRPTSLRHCAVAKQVDDTIPEAIGLCRPGRRPEAQIDQALRAAMLSAIPTPSWRSPSSLPGRTPRCRTTKPAGGCWSAATSSYSISARVQASLTRTTGTTHHSHLRVSERHHCHLHRWRARGSGSGEVYKIVWEAQQAGLAAARPGASREQVDRAARSVIECAGYGPYFPHRTGHGLGLQGHEPPYLDPGDF